MRKAHELIGVLEGVHDTLPKPFDPIVSCGMTGVFVPTGRGALRSRRALLRRAQERQHHLETLMPFGTVLPVLQGCALTRQDVPAAIETNLLDLQSWAAPLRQRCQYQAVISIQDDAEFDAGAPAGKALLRQLRTGFETAVVPVAEDALALPVAGSAVINQVLLVDRTASDALEAALEEIDAIWTDGLRIKLIGPSPAVSFCSLGFKPASKRAVARAWGVLGLEPTADPEAVSRALKSALRASSPGQPPDMLRKAAALCRKAARRPDPSAPLWDAFAWSEGRALQDGMDAREVA